MLFDVKRYYGNGQINKYFMKLQVYKSFTVREVNLILSNYFLDRVPTIQYENLENRMKLKHIEDLIRLRNLRFLISIRF
jgi:hypothetical protein